MSDEELELGNAIETDSTESIEGLAAGIIEIHGLRARNADGNARQRSNRR